MRTARIKAEGAGYYHCVSRVVDRQKKFGEVEKEKFRTMMRKVEQFSGVQILTYCVMSNHFHILVHVPEPAEVSDKELVRRLKMLYQPLLVKAFARELEDARAAGDEKRVAFLRDRYLSRMYDVSEFMKTLKQRFSVWYNRNRGRVGTLWEERFKSILVQGSENALITMASYIDLNPVRAGLVQDPKDYRYSGYGEAVGGSKVAREGLGLVMLTLIRDRVWGQVSHKYRRLLYVSGEQTVGAGGEVRKAGFSPEKVEQVLAEDGRLSTPEALRCGVRYFTDGAVLGAKEFVDGVFEKHRREFGARRKTGARAMRWGEWSGLCTMRDLRMKVVSMSER